MKKWIAICLSLVLILGLFVGCANDSTTPTEAPEEQKETYNADTLDAGIKAMSSCTVSDLSPSDPRLDEVVATCGDYTLTNSELQFYFWMSYLNFVNSISGYGVDLSAFGLDTTKPMAEQNSLTEDMNWEQYFLYTALETFRENASVAMLARDAGYTLPEDVQSYIDTLPEELETQAQSYGYDDALSFVQESFGPGATVEGYIEYVRLYYYAGYYENSIYETLDYTHDEAVAYYNENEESLSSAGISMDDETCTINVRHILITWEDEDGDGTPTDEEKETALTQAQGLLDEYLTNPTEDNFAALANEHSTDPGSNTNGGLYEDVYPGQMVTAFNDWCFDESRQTGDTGIVETSYGYHIMYFVSQSDTPYWEQYVANNGLLTQKMDALVKEMGATYDVSVDLSVAVLGEASVYGQ